MAIDPRILKAILRFGVDRETLGEVEDGARDLEDSLDAVERKLTDVREAADALSTVGETLAIAGAAMVAPFALAAQNYVQYAGRADVVSRRWLDNQRRLEQAQLRVGRVAAQAILPVMEKLADLAEDAADFAEKHPDAIKAILGIGGTLAVVGAAAATIGRAVTMFATVKGGFVALARLAGAAGAAGAAGTAAAGTAGAAGAAGAAGGLSLLGIGASALGGIAVGGGIYQAIATSKWGQSQGLANLQQYASVAAYGLGKLVGGTDTANRWFVKVSGSLGAMDEATQAATESALGLSRAGAAAAQPQRILSQAAVDTFIAYREAVDQAEQSYQEQRAAMVEQFGKSQARAEAQFQRQEARALEQYQKQRASILTRAAAEDRKAEEEYYRQRREAAEQFGIETARMEEDHQRNIERMRQTYDVRQEDAIARRNFDAFVQNERQYEADRQQAEDDYQLRATRRDEDFARQTQEAEQAYRRQKEQRQAQLTETLTEAQANFEEQSAQRAEQHAEAMAQAEEAQREQLDAAAEAHRRELQELDSALAKQLAALDENLLGEEKLRNAHYARMTADLEAWLDANSRAMRERLFAGNTSYAGYTATTGGTYAPSLYSRGRAAMSRQAGGYTRGGLYRLHGGEFVMSARTTRMAERMIGGPLTQQNVISGGAHSSLDINVAGEYNEALVPTIQQAVGAYMGEVILHLSQAQAVAGSGAA